MRVVRHGLSEQVGIIPSIAAGRTLRMSWRSNKSRQGNNTFKEMPPRRIHQWPARDSTVPVPVFRNAGWAFRKLFSTGSRKPRRFLFSHTGGELSRQGSNLDLRSSSLPPHCDSNSVPSNIRFRVIFQAICQSRVCRYHVNELISREIIYTPLGRSTLITVVLGKIYQQEWISNIGLCLF